MHYRHFLNSLLLCFLLLTLCPPDAFSAKLVSVSPLDRDYLVVHISDGEVIHQDETNKVEQVLRYTPELNTSAAVQSANWTLTSTDDGFYAGPGRHPVSISRKKKLSGHAEMEWVSNDYRYEYTYDHWIYLELPGSLQQGASYQLAIAGVVNSDDQDITFTFDHYSSISEAIHINLVGYSPDAPHKAADLYHWMGSGGFRNYASFEGEPVYLYNVDTQTVSQVGTVQFWKENGSDVHGYNLTGSDVWNIDFSSASASGTYRLVVEGIGCSHDFQITADIYQSPFTVAVRGYFYMRIGETNPNAISPPPRTPLYIPGQSPQNTIVYLTSMHPFHPDWDTFADGDKWDRPNAWIPYIKGSTHTNPDAWGGHSDAADWDRHLGHVANIYDMLLPYLMSNGTLDDDDLGITESGNGIPDLLDEARNEVDFWLRLRDGDGYSHGLTNPNDDNELFQAGPTALAAWANAANAAMLADAFRIAGLPSLMNQYRDAAIEAFDHASSLAGQMLDEKIYLDEGHLRGRDLKMTAAAFLYNVTGDTGYEDIVSSESVCNGTPSPIQYFYSGEDGINQLYATAAYLITPRAVNYPGLYSNMKAQILSEAKSREADKMLERPSRRTTYNPPSYWRTAHFVGRTIVAHAVTDSQTEKDYFRKALSLEADWGLGRNPLNMIEMTTASTDLASKRSVPEAYTSGRNDNIEGVHPGHTPYMNLKDWWQGMVMAMPSKLYENSYPPDVPNTWPIGETYFPSRWVFSHNEFTPRQTMRGKLAVYGYLYSLADTPGPTHPTLSVSIDERSGGSGTVTSSPAGIACGDDCGEQYPGGTTVTLTAQPDNGSIFLGWSGACYGATPTCNVTMEMNRLVTASFEPVGLTYQLTVTTDGNGEGKVFSTPAGIDCGNICSTSFGSGSAVTLQAIAESGSTFSGWGGACSGTGNCVLSMAADRDVTASFRLNTSPPIVIYDDELGTKWEDWSWDSSINLHGTSPVFRGSNSVNVTLQSWGGFSPSRSNFDAVGTSGYKGISFWIHGGSSSKQITVYTQDENNASSPMVTITASGDTWSQKHISLHELGNPSNIARVNFFNNSGSPIGTFSLDDIRLEPLGPAQSGNSFWTLFIPLLTQKRSP